MMTKKEAGRLGGQTTRDRYGKSHFSKIGKRGAATFWARYTVIPWGTFNWALYHRETGQIVKLLYGGYYPTVGKL